MDFNLRSKHGSKLREDLLKKCKHIRYEVVGAPENPFVAARKIQKLAETETDNVPVPPEQDEADGPPVAKKPSLETHVLAASISDANVVCTTRC